MKIGFLDAATGVMEGIVLLHDKILIYLVYILIYVFWFISIIVINFNRNKATDSIVEDKINHEEDLETIWTIIPSCILLIIGIPSFGLLYMMEEGSSPNLSIKVIGHQWFWSYEYQRIVDNVFEFDSYLLEDLNEGEFRMVETDNIVVLPEKINIRFLISSVDVLHSYAVPPFGVKVDAVPGRINQSMVYINRLGLFNGQCSELCGVNHSAMPISVGVIDLETFSEFLKVKIL